MLLLRDIIDRIFEKDDLLSHQTLAESLGVHRDTVRHWKRGTRLPSDDTMVTLSVKAGIRPLEGLLLLNIWRSEGRARTIYRKLLQEIGPTFVQKGIIEGNGSTVIYDSRDNA